MARANPHERLARGRSFPYRLGLLLACCALLLAAAGCGDDDSVFSSVPEGSSTSEGTIGPGEPGEPGEGDEPGTGQNPGASAAAVPAGAQAYIGIDLTALPRLMRLVQAFAAADPAALTEGLDLGEGAGEAVEGAEEARDVLTCLREQLLPDPTVLATWLGDEAALAAYDIELDEATGELGNPNGLVMVEVDDPAAAQTFLQDAMTALEGCAQTTFEETTYGGVTVYRGQPADSEQPLAIALAESHLLLGIGEGMVERAMDLPDGVLADDPNFNEVLEALPEGRHLSGYLSIELPQQLMASLSTSMAASGELPLPEGLDPSQALAGLRGLGLAGTMLAEGIRIDLAAVGQPAEPVPTGELTASNLPDLLPADAVGFAGVGPFDVSAAWEAILGILAQMPVEEGEPSIQQTVAMIGAMLGIDVEDDLIGQLTGEMGIGLLPATAGTLVDQAQVNLGIIAVLEVEDPGAMSDTVASMATGLAQLTGSPAAPVPFEGGTLYGLNDGTSDVLFFGMAGDHMVLTTHESHAAALLAGGPRLAGSDRYAAGIAGLPEDGTPIMFFDVTGLVAALAPEEGEAAGIAPLQSVAMSVAADGDAGTLTIFARIDY